MMPSWELTWRGRAVLGVVWRGVGQHGGEAVCGRVVGVHGQLLPEGLLLATVGEPVVHAHLRDLIGAQAVGLRRGHAPL